MYVGIENPIHNSIYFFVHLCLRLLLQEFDKVLLLRLSAELTRAIVNTQPHNI